MTDHCTSPSLQQLTLVAPMPRRPIALVARRHHVVLSSSKSRSHRISLGSGGSGSGGGSPFDELIPMTVSPSSSDKGLPTTQSRYYSVGHSSHPYSRRTSVTPSHSSSASATSSPTSTSPFLQDAGCPAPSLAAAYKSPPRERYSRRRRSLRSAIECLEEAAAAASTSSFVLPPPAPSSNDPAPTQQREEEDEAEDAMSILDDDEHRERQSPEATATARPSQDVERTPTKKQRCRHNDASSTPTADATPQQADTVAEPMTVSPISPKTQRRSAHAQLSASIASCFSASASPSLSPSRSRSPSTSPSPCPSPSLRPRSAASMRSDCSPDLGSGLLCAWSFYEEDGFDVRPSHGGKERDGGPSENLGLASPPSSGGGGGGGMTAAGEARKLGLPLPVPSSPIPRRMTRNPFERFLRFDLDLSVSEDGGDHESGLGRRSLDADRRFFLSLSGDHVARRSVTLPFSLSRSKAASALGLFQGTDRSPADGDADDVSMKDGPSRSASEQGAAFPGSDATRLAA
ncbi:hypothetical protein ACQY0O_002080 [Thecaphora frezii]